MCDILTDYIHKGCAMWIDHIPNLVGFLFKTELAALVGYLLPCVKIPIVFKFQVCDYYFFLKGPAAQAIFADALSLRVCCYAVYAANLYRFSRLLKKEWGNRAKGAYYVTLCQKIATYSYLGALPASMTCPKMFAVHSFTAATSFFYHNAVAVGDQDRLVWFALDSIAVHAILLMNMSCVSVAPFFKIASFLVNITGLVLRVHIVDLDNVNAALAMSYPCVLLDLGMFLTSDADPVLKFEFMHHIYLIGLVTFFELFNDMSYICVHVILWFNAYIMAEFMG
jgi:hypothetical protein